VVALLKVALVNFTLNEYMMIWYDVTVVVVFALNNKLAHNY